MKGPYMLDKTAKIPTSLFSVQLDKEDAQRLAEIAAAKKTTKAGAFRDWLKNAHRAIEAKRGDAA
jgi:hypothetical protein